MAEEPLDNEDGSDQSRAWPRLALLVAGPPLLASLLAGAAFLYVDRLAEGQHARNRFLRAEIHLRDERISEVRELMGRREELLTRARIILGLTHQARVPVLFLDELRRAPPSGVLLTRVEVDGRTLELTGIADSALSVSAYIGALDQAAHIHRPAMAELARAPLYGETATSFRVTAELDEDEDEDEAW